MVKNQIINTLKSEIGNGNHTRLHITQIDYEPQVKYNTACGIYVNDELKHSFELENISNHEIEDFKIQVNKEMNNFRVYLI